MSKDGGTIECIFANKIDESSDWQRSCESQLSESMARTLPLQSGFFRTPNCENTPNVDQWKNILGGTTK